MLKENSVFNITKDGKVSSDNDIIADADGNKYSLSEVGENAVRYNADKTTVTLAGVKGTTITNVADGINDKDAVNVSQLKAVANAEDYVESGSFNNQNGTITLNRVQGEDVTITGLEDYAVKEGNILAQDGSATITVEDRYNPANTKEVKIDGLVTYNTKTITEGGITTTVTDYDNIKLAGKNGTLITNLKDGYVGEYSTDAVNGSQLYATNQKVDAGWTATDGTTNIAVNPKDGTTTLKFAGDNNITVTADAENNAINVELNPDVNLKGEGDNSDNRVWLSGSNGTITVTTENNLPEKTTVINGGNVYVGSSVSVGDKVEITDKDITGLSNTEWNGTTTTPDRAATEGQLKDVSDTVNAGWTATDGNGASIVVNPENGSTLNFAGDRNIEVKANEKDGSIDVSLKDDIVLGGKEDTSRVEIGGTNGTIMATKDPNSMIATTTIDGGNVYVGSSISVGDKVEITDKDITGLSNTSWNGTTDDESRAATEGQLKDVSDTVNAGWTATDSNGASIVVNPENGSTLNFAGDRNIEVKANEKDGSIDVSLKDDMVLGGKEGTSRVEIGGTNGTIMATKDPNSMAATTTIDGGNVYVGSSISVGDKVEITDKDITGLSNTEWNGTTTTPDRAATEGQLQQVSNDVNAGWIATDNNGSQVNITPDNNKLNFAGDENITVTAANNEIKTTLNDNIKLGGYFKSDDAEEAQNYDGVLISGSSGTISATNAISVGKGEGQQISISTGEKGRTIYGLTNTEWNDDIANAAAVKDSVEASTAATQGQLQEVSKVANAGWNASDGTNSISIKPNETLGFVGDENLTVSADGTDKKIKVSLNDNINLNDRVYINGAPENTNTIIDIKSNDKSNSIFAVEDKGKGSISIGGIDITNVDGPYLAVGDGKLKFYKDGGLSTGNATGTFSVRPDGDLEISGKNSIFNVDAETGNINAINNSDSAIMMNDDSIALNASGNGVVVDDEGITLNTNGSLMTMDSVNGTTFTNTNTGETTNINGGTITTNTVKGLDNTTWDDELAKQVANSEELQGTAATQGQLQQAVSEVATEAAKQHTTITAGDDNLIVESTVNANGGTNYEVSLSDEITLGDVTNKTESLTLSSDGTYIPASANAEDMEFIDNHGGGFIIYSNKADGSGLFAVTADGMVHARDVISYYDADNDPSTDNTIKYSLNDVGDIVTQIAHDTFTSGEDATQHEYTIIADFQSESDKDNPFIAETGTDTLSLAVRDDGTVIIGAQVDSKGQIIDSGIRINENGEDATITGLENTEWKPTAPQTKIATFGETTTTETSRAATEAQLDDLYNAVAVYNTFNQDGSVNYDTIKLRGIEYGTHGKYTDGTSITNVAYAVTDRTSEDYDGSAAVNVDVLNDALDKATSDGGVISNSDKHLISNPDTTNGHYSVNGDGEVDLIVADETGNKSEVTIDNIASKDDITNLDNKIDNTFNDLNNKIENINNVETDVKGGSINEDGTISLKTENEDGTTTDIKLNGQLTDSAVVQEGTSFDKETGTITITSQDKYSGETSSIKVEGIASTEVVGATNKEDLATAYKDADKDGNATTEYITDSESMVEADVALDHAIQDVAGTSYANDMVLSNRIDSVEKRLGNVEERIDKVGAMAAAIANLRTMGFDPEAPTEIAIGVGQYKSETGIAIGVFHYPNQDFMLSASLSSSGDELMGGIGATWKLGRKSAAERAKDEEARHLEQAEEMKKLAQQEKVKAQAQRHAKLLAERQQASQKNA
ncbi:YadA-like family protein [Megamonas rupellensis]|uniref:YadA-like family protein n=1 Tax=Megamonas rupellensis TaxID=491921 RepID=UPI00241E9DEC|nr:YadA-like family protein [Megamonas rupellensis]